MREQEQSKPAEEKRYIVQITEFGNSAHTILPKDLIGQTARIEIVGSWIPPLFEGVQEGTEVILEKTSGDRIDGEVIDIKSDDFGAETRHQFVLDTGRNFYRVSIRRDWDEDEWPDEYQLEKAVSGEEFREEVDEIVSLEGGELWAPDGEIQGLAVMESAD